MPAPAAELTASALLEALAGSASFRRVLAVPPLTAALLVANIEVATVSGSDEDSMRRAWRERHGGGAIPLLLLADDGTRRGCVRALGPSDSVGPIRIIEAAALHGVLARVAGLSRLEATREIADELGRLDQSGIPGLRLRELLTLHTLDVRMRRDPVRWSAAAQAVRSIPPGADWQGVLRGLGYRLERRPHTGYLVKTADDRRVAVVHPKANLADLSRLDADGRPPEGRLLNDCDQEGVAHGLLAHQSRLRLFETTASAGATSTRYLELDAARLRAEDRPLLALLGPDHLSGNELARLRTEAAAFGAALKRRLDDTIRNTVLPTLGRAAGRWCRARGDDPADDAIREELERASLTLLFRCLFLLYAESAGHLPMDNHFYRSASLSSLVAQANETKEQLSERSTSLWDRLALLVKAMRRGNPAWGVPAYNGDLFAPDGFDGAATLERMELADPEMATILIGLGLDPDGDVGIDYSTLEIGNLGHIYEGLLSLRLSVADAPLAYDARSDRYTPVAPDAEADVQTGDLLWQTHEGGRKTGGVYYTPAELVGHLVRQTVRPAFAAHLERIRDVAQTDPRLAAQQLLDFAVLDPACGSAHFLVVVVAELADQLVRFLAGTPLPEFRIHLERLRAGATSGTTIDDATLIRRLALKQCVYGVDVSPMGAEVAKLSLWLASFVPGLSLAYLGRNVIVGNSLVGVARPEAVQRKSELRRRRGTSRRAGELTVEEPSWLDAVLERALREAAEAVARVAGSDDRNPDEVAQSEAADAEAHRATAGLRAVFDLWTAEPFGLAGARHEVELHGTDILAGRANGHVAAAHELAEQHRFLHWSLAFPRIFSRARPGFDVVVGNPPWNEVTVEERSFYAFFKPGIHGSTETSRAALIAGLVAARPELPERLRDAQGRTRLERAALSAGEYASMPGDPDLYKFFCQRYAVLLRAGGRLGVVLPRSALSTQGSAGFREWLFTKTICERVDTLLNSRFWMFDSEPRYTVALLMARAEPPDPDHVVRVAGTARSTVEWEQQMHSRGVELALDVLGPGLSVPLLRSAAEASVLNSVRLGRHLPLGTRGRWSCFPVRELDETNDRSLWQGTMEGWPLWKGESFDQYAPTGAGERFCPATDGIMRKVLKKRPGDGSMIANHVPLVDRQRAVAEIMGGPRIAFRDVARATDSRTVRACLVPPKTFLTNTAPYLAFVDGGEAEQMTCLGIMNSLPFDWQARRFAEIHLNFFILEGLIVPDLDDEAHRAIATAAGRLSCVDDRYADFAATLSVDCGPLSDEEKLALRVEIDARVARAWRLTQGDLDTMLADFTLDAVPREHRDRLHARVSQLS